MSINELLLVWTGAFIVILARRAVSIFAPRGRALPLRVIEAPDLIPPAAFAALVANDLFSPAASAGGLWAGAMPLLTAAVVFLAAWRTKSMLRCCACGVAAYLALSLVDAKVLYKCERFDLKSRRLFRDEEKYYLADPGIYFARNVDVRLNYGPSLENVLYLYFRLVDTSCPSVASGSSSATSSPVGATPTPTSRSR